MSSFNHNFNDDGYLAVIMIIVTVVILTIGAILMP